jgi:hypothetical protein
MAAVFSFSLSLSPYFFLAYPARSPHVSKLFFSAVAAPLLVSRVIGNPVPLESFPVGPSFSSFVSTGRLVFVKGWT